MRIKERSRHPVDLSFFGNLAIPETVVGLQLHPPAEEQHVLRMLVRRYDSKWAVPESLAWIEPMIVEAWRFQRRIARHPFVYVTVRHGKVKSTGDDEWHVDGFSTRYTHLPEQNYIWTTGRTQFLQQRFKFPEDFDPLKHNVHKYIQRRADKLSVVRGRPETVYAIDPYVIHRRHPNDVGERTFVRVTFAPIEIADVNNTINPGLKTEYTRDGVKEFRDLLEDYDAVCDPGPVSLDRLR